MTNDQLELLDWQPPKPEKPGVLVPFWTHKSEGGTLGFARRAFRAPSIPKRTGELARYRHFLTKAYGTNFGDEFGAEIAQRTLDRVKCWIYRFQEQGGMTVAPEREGTVVFFGDYRDELRSLREAPAVNCEERKHA